MTLEPFKNNFSPQLVACIAGQLERHLPGFARAAFEGPVFERLEPLELKQRAQLIADHLHTALPEDHGTRADVLRAMLASPPAERTSDDEGISGWGVFPLTLVVGQHGLDDFEGSLALLKDMTSRFTSEFGVRYFLLADQERALATLRGWVDDPDHHVRRLVSEGTRPRLPWAMQLPRLIADPSPMLPLLRALRDDPEIYVRRSVANHLNDIAKDHPDVIAQLSGDWMRGADEARRKLVRHACRTLIKQGHAAVLATFGYGEPEISLDRLSVETGTVALGDAVTFSADLRSRSDRPQPLLIDYLLHFRKANGKLASKVFKWKTLSLQPGECRPLRRSHSIRPITTRRYHAGQQALSLRINGQDFGLATFDLTVETLT